MNERRETVGPAALGLMKYVHVLFFAGAVVIGWLLVNVIETTWTALNLSVAWVPPPSNWAVVGSGAVIAGLGALYLWRHPKVNRLAVEIVTELSKVTWPTRKELSASTVVVIVVSIIAAIILGLFDFFWAWITDQIYT